MLNRAPVFYYEKPTGYGKPTIDTPPIYVKPKPVYKPVGTINPAPPQQKPPAFIHPAPPQEWNPRPMDPIAPTTRISVVTREGVPISATIKLNGTGGRFHKSGSQYIVSFNNSTGKGRVTMSAKGYKTRSVFTSPGRVLRIILEKDNSAELAQKKKLIVVRAKARLRILKLTSI